MRKVIFKQCDSFPEVHKLINLLIGEITDLQFEVAKLGAVKAKPAEVAETENIHTQE